MECLFCQTHQPKTTVEHIIPESLGNKDLILENQVCDQCQNYFGREVENYVLNKTPIGFWRAYFGIPNKKGKLPIIDFTKPSNKKGYFPDSHSKHIDAKYLSHPDGTIEFFPPKDFETKNHEEGRIEFVMTPKTLFEMGRFIGKIALELICLENEEYSRNIIFDKIRYYSRFGSSKELWPIFHLSVGDIQNLISVREVGNKLQKTAILYEYAFSQSDEYTIFSLKIGVDQWAICLNEQYPDSKILELIRRERLSMMWYPPNSF